MKRRDFLQAMCAAGISGLTPNLVSAKLCQPDTEDSYQFPKFGNISLFHITDTHAQLLPTYFREPAINIGVGAAEKRPPHLVGQKFLKHFNIAPGSGAAHAFTHINYVEAAHKFGKMGGYAHLATLIKLLRSQRKHSLLLDGGDSWQGSATALWTQGQDMVDANLKLGVDVMTGHWEFTYGAERVKKIVSEDFAGKIDFLAQNIVDKDFEDPVFKPFVIKELNQIPVAIIGQAFPYTPIANPRYLMPQWSFGIREESLQRNIDLARKQGAQVVVLLSHNGMDVDLKLASRMRNLDVILGGHTHDAVPKAMEIKNSSGKTLVINSGSNGKYVSVLDLDVRNKSIKDFRYRLVPVFSRLIKADTQMSEHIEKVRKPFLLKLNEPLAVSDDLLYRRDTFIGSFDQIILDALLQQQDAEIAFSPGFRWGTSLLPGQIIRYEDLMNMTAITYPTVTLNQISGKDIKAILEDIADNIFHDDPYFQQGGDMVRVGGMQFTIEPKAKIGNRIGNMQLKGKALQANKKYKVAGWASVKRQKGGVPIWDLVAEYLRDKKVLSLRNINAPKIKGV